MGRSSLFEMGDGEHVRCRTRLALSQLGVMVVATMGRWTGVEILIVIIIIILSVQGTTLKANTWIPFPTWPHLDITTRAQVSSPMESRLKYPQVVQLSFSVFQTGLACCWRLG